MFFRKKTPLVDARRLGATDKDVLVVTQWMVANDYPWLLGDPARPELLAPEGGLPGSHGIYVSPIMGALVVRTRSRQVLHADYGDWVLLNPYTNEFEVVKAVAFEILYEPVV